MPSGPIIDGEARPKRKSEDGCFLRRLSFSAVNGLGFKSSAGSALPERWTALGRGPKFAAAQSHVRVQFALQELPPKNLR
jgi:hypothetical protein